MAKKKSFENIISNILGEPVSNLCHAFYDQYVEANVRFRSRAGMKELIIRRQLGKCCKWCADLAGIYTPENAPADIYRRHDNCKCMVTYKDEDGYTDVWSKKEFESYKEARISRESEMLRDSVSNLALREERIERLHEILEYSHKGLNRKTEIAKSIIESPDYSRRLSSVDDNRTVSNKIIEEARKILKHRSGTLFEDLMYIDIRDGSFITRTDYNKPRKVMPSRKMIDKANKSPDYTIATIHNHPGSTAPSPGDIHALYERKNAYGVVLCHDGTIYKYSIKVADFNEPAYASAFDKLSRSEYNVHSINEFIGNAEKAGVVIELL